MEIPFNKYVFSLRSKFGLVTNVLFNRIKSISGGGDFTRLVQDVLTKIYSNHHVMLTSSGSSSLDLMFRIARKNYSSSDNEIVCPSFTFPTSVSSLISSGFKPVFCDIDIETLSLDFNLVKEIDRTNIFGVNLTSYNGNINYLDQFEDYCKINNYLLFVDNSHGFRLKSNDLPPRFYGDFNSVSFHETKNLSSGEGGYLYCKNVNDFKLGIHLRDKGTNRNEMILGLSNKYEWVALGSNYQMSDILASLLSTELSSYQKVFENRKRKYLYYLNNLEEWARNMNVLLPSHNNHNFHVFYMIFNSIERRSNFTDYMKSHGVTTPFHYQPLHTSNMGISLGYSRGSLPVTEFVSKGLIRLPLFRTLKHFQQNYIIEKILNYHG
jgi:dTDP-4-amino-4,6-dideoxygalactose transaminase